MKVDRSAFTADEWKLYKQGKCSATTAYGHAPPWIEHCGKKLDRRNPWGYCKQHAKEAVEDYGWRA